MRSGTWLVIALLLGGAGALAVLASKREHAVSKNEEIVFDDFGFRVVSTRATDALGPPAQPTKASGRFHVVTLRVANHAQVASFRFTDMRPMLTDAAGAHHAISKAGQAALLDSGNPDPFARTLRAGDSADFEFAFDLPTSSPPASLWISMGGPVLNALEGLVFGNQRILLQ